MGKIKKLQSVCALLLTLAMLVGMVSVMGAFPATATTSAVTSLVATFNAAKDEGGYGHYITSTDDAWYTYIDSRFNTYYDLDGTLEQRKPISGVTAGTVWDYIYELYNLQCGFKSGTNQTSNLKSVGTLVPKTADGDEAVLKNFELSFTTRWAEATFNNASAGAIVIGFRQQTAGKITDGVGAVNKDQGLIIISSKGISIAGGNEITDDMYSLNNEQTFTSELNPKASSNLTFHKVTVRVVDNTVSVSIGDNTYTDTINYNNPGYLAFGAGAFRFLFRDIEITRLDEAGNAIDWNEQQYQMVPTKVTYSASDLLGRNGSQYPNGKDNIEYTDSTLSATQRTEYIETLNSMFNVYYNDYDGTDAIYTQNSSVVGNSIGYNYAKLQWYNNHAWLRPVAISGYGSLTGSALRQVGSLVPKDADGEQLYLKNFELNTSFAFWTGTTGHGTIVVGFRQEQPGRYYTDDGKAVTGSYLMVTNNNVYVYENGELKHESSLAQASNGGIRNLNIKVVGNQLTYTVSWGTTPFASGTVELSTSRHGYLALSNTHYLRSYSVTNIDITALDDAGNPTPIKERIIPNTVSVGATDLLGFTGSAFANGGTNILLDNASLTEAQREVYLNFMNDRFDAYYNDYDGTDVTYLKQNSVVGNTVGYNYNRLMSYKGNLVANPLWNWPTAAASGYGDISTNAMRKIGSLVIKDDDGEQLYLKNFTLTTAFEQQGGNAKGSNIIAFRQETPGKFYTDTGDAAVGTYMQFSNGVVYVVENGVTVHSQECAALAPPSIAKVDITVIGNTLTYTITSGYNGGGPYTGTVTLSTARYGYMALALNNVNHMFDIANTSITALDDVGNPTPIKEQDSKYHGGNITVDATVKDGVYTNTITVTPDEGFELLAGSLIATDASGNRYVPTRVGFREGGGATQYVVVCDVPITVNGTFIQPSLSDPNIGNVGTSVNSELHGLRFVSRFNRVVEDGVEYVVLDGQKYPVKDYGMLVGLDMVIGDDTLDLALAKSNQYIVKASIHDKQVYYDKCDDYIDMSVCVTNLHNLPDGLALRVASRAYVIIDDGSEEGLPLYADTFSSTYEYSAGVETATFAELFANEQVIRHGRAGMVNGEYQMDWVNTGFEVSGEIAGSVKVKMSSDRTDSLLNVMVDGGEPQIVHVPSGTSTVTLASNLTEGEHTIKVISGTSVRQGTLSATALQYIGTLDTVERDNGKLQMTVLGDSISCGWGMGILSGGSYTTTEIIAGSNSYDSYATITANNLDAYLDVVAQCSQTISEIHNYASVLNKRSGAPAWEWEEQDIIVVNLGTNDEWRSGFTADTALTDATALLEDMRERNPNAYIIYVYSMMTDYTQNYADYLVSYKAAVQSLVDKGDDKVFMLQMTPNKVGYEGHPDTAAHAGYAEVLTAFIKEKCPDLFGHTTHTETLADLEANDTVVFSGRTAASGTARTMTYSNTGITIDGYLYGDLTMDVTVASNVCALNVVIDGDVINAKTVWVDAGSSTVTLVDNLRRGYHTIEITKGTAHHAGLLTMKSITYTGTLVTPTEKDLQIEFIGDSVTVGEGMYGDITPLSKSYNAIDGYAAQVANTFGAGVSTIAQCGARVPGMTTQFNDWTDFKNNQKDIVVINLGTNDFGWSSYADYDITTAYYPTTTSYSDIKMKDAITGLIDDVRTAYPDAYIIWTYGMMFDQHLDALEGMINEYATTTNDAKLLFCDVSAAKDNSGKSSHPSTTGNNNAAILLSAFIRENCAELLPTTAEVEKTYATDRVLKVACVGDSITAQSYWNDNMRGELSTDNYEVSGFGVSGSTALFKGVDYVNASTNAGKAYVDQAAYTNSLSYGADAVVVMLGTNDSKDVNWPVYADEFIANYVEIVRSFQNSDSAPMVFIALPPTVYSTGKFQGISNTRIENFIIPALYEVAAQTGAIVIDTHTPTGGNSALMTDGVHPADAGKQILCETIAAAIKADTGRE